MLAGEFQQWFFGRFLNMSFYINQVTLAREYIYKYILYYIYIYILYIYTYYIYTYYNRLITWYLEIFPTSISCWCGRGRKIGGLDGLEAVEFRQLRKKERCRCFLGYVGCWKLLLKHQRWDWHGISWDLNINTGISAKIQCSLNSKLSKPYHWTIGWPLAKWLRRNESMARSHQDRKELEALHREWFPAT